MEMISILALVIGIFLILISIIDIKVRAIPSIFLTGMIFVVLAINQDHLFIGILAFIMAWLLYEAEFYSGVADLKVFTLIGIMIVPTIYYLFALIILTGIYGITWKAIMKLRSKDNEDAFVPVFFFVYLSLVLMGGIR